MKHGLRFVALLIIVLCASPTLAGPVTCEEYCRIFCTGFCRATLQVCEYQGYLGEWPACQDQCVFGCVNP